MVETTMTNVSNLSGFRIFWKVLKVYYTSIYKLVWRELVVYLIFFYFIQIIYRLDFPIIVRHVLEQIHHICNHYANMIPITFVLVFIVSLAVNRWWNMYFMLPTTDTISILVNAAIPDDSEKDKITRKTIVRYALVSYVLVLRQISIWMSKKFPTVHALVDAGLLLENEVKMLESIDENSTVNVYGVPLVWAIDVIHKNCDKDTMKSDVMVQTLLMELVQHRHKLEQLLMYSIMPIPLVCYQVATICVFCYFVVNLFGYQLFETGNNWGILIDSLLGSLLFVFYLGWLKVAWLLSNPFDETDEDFEFNKKICCNIKAGYMIGNEMRETDPTLEQFSSQYESIRSLPNVDTTQPKTVNEYPNVSVNLENETDIYLNQEEEYVESYESSGIETTNMPMYDYSCGFTQPKNSSSNLSMHMNSDTFNNNNSELHPFVQYALSIPIKPAESSVEGERAVHVLSRKRYYAYGDSPSMDLDYDPTKLNYIYNNMNASIYDDGYGNVPDDTYDTISDKEHDDMYDNISDKVHDHMYENISDKVHDDTYESIYSSTTQFDYSATSIEEENSTGYMYEQISSQTFYKLNFPPEDLKLAPGQESNICRIENATCKEVVNNDYNLVPPIHLLHSLSHSIHNKGNTPNSFQSVSDDITSWDSKENEMICCERDDKSEQEHSRTSDDSSNIIRELTFYKEFEITL